MQDLPGLRMERATPADLSAVRELAAGEALPWTPGAWQKFVEPVDGTGVGRAVLWVARDAKGTVRGWLAASAVFETAELEYVVVAPTDRHRGLGRWMVEYWLRQEQVQGATEAMLEVRVSNLPARRLYAGLGFAERGRRPEYYRNPVEDALVLVRSL